TQSMTVFRDQDDLADRAIKIAIALVNKTNFLQYTHGTINNKFKEVPVYWGEATTVTKDNLKLLIDKGYMTADDVYQK
ncbi:MAG: sugar ABC transporter substrate-binding protein, partial [Spirochaetia bacterium]